MVLAAICWMWYCGLCLLNYETDGTASIMSKCNWILRWTPLSISLLRTGNYAAASLSYGTFWNQIYEEQRMFSACNLYCLSWSDCSLVVQEISRMISHSKFYPRLAACSYECWDSISKLVLLHLFVRSKLNQWNCVEVSVCTVYSTFVSIFALFIKM
jgi:hypothetical protein